MSKMVRESSRNTIESRSRSHASGSGGLRVAPESSDDVHIDGKIYPDSAMTAFKMINGKKYKLVKTTSSRAVAIAKATLGDMFTFNESIILMSKDNYYVYARSIF